MAGTNLTAPPGAPLLTAGDIQRDVGQELLAAHLHLQRARELLLELRVRTPPADWSRALPVEGGAS